MENKQSIILIALKLHCEDLYDYALVNKRHFNYIDKNMDFWISKMRHDYGYELFEQRNKAKEQYKILYLSECDEDEACQIALEQNFLHLAEYMLRNKFLSAKKMQKENQNRKEKGIYFKISKWDFPIKTLETATLMENEYMVDLILKA